MALTKDKVIELVEKAITKYSKNQKQSVFSQLPYMQFDNEVELQDFIKETQSSFDKEATPDEMETAFKHFRL